MATLVRLLKTPGKGKNARDTVAPDPKFEPFKVQFNPTSLKISRQNNVDKGGSTTRTQARQNPSTQSATLSFDLEYDTAEGDGAGAAADVRTRTQQIRQFVEPNDDRPGDPPPPVRFIWGTFHFSGIVSQVTEDLDYFSPHGMPLRAKLSVVITEQDPKWEANVTGPGTLTAKAATRPGEAGAKSGLGAAPPSKPDSTAAAQAGESLQQMLARLGADPATWRAAMAGLGSPLSLAAGAQVQLSAGISASAGIGMSAGFAAGAQLGGVASLGAALGVSGVANLGAGAGVSAVGGLSAGAGFSVSAEMTAGFALAAGGGVSASLNTVLSARAAAETSAARGAFEVPAASARAALSSAPAPVDPRTQTFGMSIPLRARPAAITVSGRGQATRA